MKIGFHNLKIKAFMVKIADLKLPYSYDKFNNIMNNVWIFVLINSD